jgi:hypothetical protein
MSNRIIKSTNRKSSIQLADCLASLFALELLSPSQQLYLFSPWLSDVPLFSNTFGQFRPLMPEMYGSKVRLSQILNMLAERGTTVYIVCRPHQEGTEAFLRKVSPQIVVRRVKTLHEKGLMSDHFYLRGSMNFTYSGVNINDEHVEFTTEAAAVAGALLEAKNRWEVLGV